MQGHQCIVMPVISEFKDSGNSVIGVQSGTQCKAHLCGVCRVWAFSFQRNTQMRPIEALQWMKGNEEYYKVKYGHKGE